jgi:Cu/Ag efflux pump CusA
VRRSETTLLQGIQVGSVFEQQKVFEVMVQGAPETRRNPASVRNLLIDRPSGGHVRLGQVADVRVARTPAVIERDAVSRYIDVEADVSGRSLDSVAGEVETRLAKLDFPIEYHAQVLKEATGEEVGMPTVFAFAFAAAIAILLLFQAGMGSWRLAAIAFLTLPVAVAGGVLGPLLDGAEISLGSWIGFLALLGLAARAGMLLVGRFQDLERTGAEIFGPALVRRGAGDRLLPVLTSAAAVVAVMLPFAVMGGIPGLEVVHPMAMVIVGGLVTSTFVSLIVMPALYLRFGDGGGPVPGLNTAREPVPATHPGPDRGETDAMERSAGVVHGRRRPR